jgi:hypothetical protein
MRSDLVFGALVHASNRYHLCRLVSKAAREFHRPKTRFEDTTNDVLVRLSDSRRIMQIAPRHPHFQEWDAA